jgi:hypothetical protein
MRLRLDVTAELCVLENDGRGAWQMNDWAKNWAGKIKKRHDDRTLHNAKFVEEQKLKKEFGPPLWATICEEVKTRCEALNNEMNEQILTYQFTRQGEISVIGNLDGKRKELRAAFNQQTSTINWESAGHRNSLSLKVSDDGTGAAFYGGEVTMVPSTPQSIARQMLDPLLDA